MAQPLAGSCSVADGAVMLDQQLAVAVAAVDDLRHVALVAPHRSERREDIVAAGESTPIRRQLLGGPLGDDRFEAGLADRRPDRLDQRNRQVGVAVGEELDGELGERPLDRWTTGAGRGPWCGAHEAVVGEVGEMLTDRFGADLEAIGELGPRQRPPFEGIDDPSLGRADTCRLGHGATLDTPTEFAKWVVDKLGNRFDSVDMSTVSTPRSSTSAPAAGESRAGTLDELRSEGHLLTKVGRHPVVVFWHEDRAWAIEDRCPHLGLPLHQGTVESGMVTCHWHHARFDLSSGCTLDPWADDAPAYDVEVRDGEVYVRPRPDADAKGRLYARLEDGLEDRISLVVAKSVLGLLDLGEPADEIVAVGARFGAKHRAGGWGSGMTVLTAMANVLPWLRSDDRPLALTHALAFLADDVGGHAPRFALDPLDGTDADADRLADWYRRFIDTRSGDAAERALATALAGDGATRAEVEAMMFAAVTDHVFIDEGHTVDFTNKAFELIDLLGAESAPLLLPTLVHQTAAATRHEELSAWRHPHDLAALIARTDLVVGDGSLGEEAVADLAAELLADDPEAVLASLEAAGERGASAEQLARAVAYAASLRILRFHTQNDHRDWNEVHHALTTANAVHQAVVRGATPELLRGVIHSAMKVYLDRFLNVPAARFPQADIGSLAALAECWETQGRVEDAGREAAGFLAAGGDPAELIGALGHALLVEDAGFHWFQIYEATVRQYQAWPAGSEPSRLVLVAFARFLAAHTPTRRERSRVVDIARRLRRGDELFNDADEPASSVTITAGR